jgi:Multisubunit Na+/H+ antiporter, MnhF subunit
MILAALWGMVISGMIGFVRVILGPSAADRLVAADALSVIFTMVLVLLSLYLETSFLLDVALAFSVLSFADMLLMAKYFEHGELHK